MQILETFVWNTSIFKGNSSIHSHVFQFDPGTQPRTGKTRGAEAGRPLRILGIPRFSAEFHGEKNWSSKGSQIPKPWRAVWYIYIYIILFHIIYCIYIILFHIMYCKYIILFHIIYCIYIVLYYILYIYNIVSYILYIYNIVSYYILYIYSIVSYYILYIYIYHIYIYI